MSFTLSEVSILIRRDISEPAAIYPPGGVIYNFNKREKRKRREGGRAHESQHVTYCCRSSSYVTAQDEEEGAGLTVVSRQVVFCGDENLNRSNADARLRWTRHDFFEPSAVVKRGNWCTMPKYVVHII